MEREAHADEHEGHGGCARHPNRCERGIKAQSMSSGARPARRVVRAWTQQVRHGRGQKSPVTCRGLQTVRDAQYGHFQ